MASINLILFVVFTVALPSRGWGLENNVADDWRLPAINWTAGGVVAPTAQYAIRAIDAIYWPADSKWYVYTDLVLFSNPECPASFGSEIGAFSADSLDGQWSYHGIVAQKNTSEADAGGLATPTAIVHDGRTLFPNQACFWVDIAILNNLRNFL